MLLAGLLLGLLIPIYANAGPPANGGASRISVLEKMIKSVRQEDYAGTFIYQNGDALSTLKITHFWIHEKTHERLITDSGIPREVFIDGNRIVYLNPARKTGLILNRKMPPGLPTLLLQDLVANPYYRYRMGGINRVAGLACREIVLEPVDALRYGRRFCLGLKSNFPLETDVFTSSGAIIERVIFTAFRRLPRTSVQSIVIPDSYAGYTMRHIKVESSVPSNGWEFTHLPPGFKLCTSRERDFGLFHHAVHQLVITDGIVIISVFITPQAGKVSLPRSFRRGGLNIYRASIGHDRITVMGVAPARTILDVAHALRLEQPLLKK